MMKKIINISIFCFIFVFVVGYKFFNPLHYKYFPKCPINYFTGVQCPGCGSQRALHSLLNFDIIQAFNYNQLLVVSIPYIIFGLYLNIKNKLSEKEVKIKHLFYGINACYIILVVILLFTLLRNIKF